VLEGKVGEVAGCAIGGLVVGTGRVEVGCVVLARMSLPVELIVRVVKDVIFGDVIDRSVLGCVVGAIVGVVVGLLVRLVLVVISSLLDDFTVSATARDVFGDVGCSFLLYFFPNISLILIFVVSAVVVVVFFLSYLYLLNCISDDDFYPLVIIF